jgi:hypothetical protein
VIGSGRYRGTVRLFLRGLFLQAGWNRERMQALGFTFALLPWLPRGRERERAFLHRHLTYVNTSPPLSGLLLGLVATAEEKLASIPEVAIPGDRELDREHDPVEIDARAHTDAWKRRLEGPLAAIGDRLFWGFLRPLLGVLGLFLLLGGTGGGALPRALGGHGGHGGAGLSHRALVALLAAFAFYNGPHLVTRLRAVRRGLDAGRGPDPDEALRTIGHGLGLTRLGALLEWLGPILLGALLGRFVATLGMVAAGSAGPWPALALLASGIFLGAGGARYRVPPERVGMGVLAFLLLVTA